MKTTKLLLLGIAVILLSCSEGEDSLPTSQGMIGTWTITEVDHKRTTTETIQGTMFIDDYAGTAKDIGVSSTFSKNPFTVTTEGNYVIVLKSTDIRQTATMEVPIEEVALDGTWTLDGRILTITGPIGPQKATVLEQTPATLKISTDVKETESGLGVTLTRRIQTVYTFKKN